MSLGAETDNLDPNDVRATAMLLADAIGADAQAANFMKTLNEAGFQARQRQSFANEGSRGSLSGNDMRRVSHHGYDSVSDGRRACGSLGGKIPQAALGPRGSIGGKARQPSIGGSGLMRPGLSRSNTVSGLERRISQHGYDAVGRSSASPCPAPVKRRESSP